MNALKARAGPRAHFSRRNLASIGAMAVVSIASPSVADVLTVDDDGPADFFRIQDAIDAASDGDEVVVAPGRYIHLKEIAGDFDEQVVDLDGKAIRLRSSHGPEVTVIDGRGVQRCISCRSAEGRDTEIVGFTFKNGMTKYGGGGMLNASTDPTVINCIFQDNHAETGGAVLNVYSNSLIVDCSFIGNTASENGGGIFNFGSISQVTGCRFSGNIALFGGAIFVRSKSPASLNITDCTFLGNQAFFGGAIHAESTEPMLDGCIFALNEAEFGGAMSNYQSNPSITNCSFISNESTNGGGLNNEAESAPIIIDCQFMSNSASDGGGAIHNESGASSSVSGTLFCGNDRDSITGSWTDAGGNRFLDHCPMTPDLDGDGLVDGRDLTLLLGTWGFCEEEGETCIGDLNFDYLVDGFDLAILLANWTGR